MRTGRPWLSCAYEPRAVGYVEKGMRAPGTGARKPGHVTQRGSLSSEQHRRLHEQLVQQQVLQACAGESAKRDRGLFSRVRPRKTGVGFAAIILGTKYGRLGTRWHTISPGNYVA